MDSGRVVKHVVATWGSPGALPTVHQWPKAQRDDEHQLAQWMVPLGAGNARAANDWTMFILDRQRAAHSATSLRNRQRTSLAGEWIAGDSTIAAAAGGIAVSAFVYRCLAENGEWEMYGTCEMNVNLIPFSIQVENNGVIFRHFQGADIEHEQLEDMFHGVIHDDVAYGFRFHDSTEHQLFVEHCESLSSGGAGVGGEQDVVARLNIRKRRPTDETDPVEETDNASREMLYCLSLVHQLKGGENESSGADEDSAMGVGGGGASGSNNSNGGVGGIGQPIAAGAASASTVVGVNAPVTSAAPSTTTATSTAAAPTSASGAVAVVNHTISRGPSIAIAVCATVRYVHVFKPLILLALEHCKQQLMEASNSNENGVGGSGAEEEDTTREALLSRVVRDLYVCLDNVDYSVVGEAQPKVIDAHVLWSRVLNERSYVSTAPVHYLTYNKPLHIPILLPSDELPMASLTRLLHRFTTHTMLIYNAVLLESRILFVGTALTAPIKDIIPLVLAAAHLVSPPLHGIIQRRCLPMAMDPNDLSWATWPGFIVGTASPTIRDLVTCDLLCDVDTGRVTVLQKIGEDSESLTHQSMDSAFYASLTETVLGQPKGEERLRLRFAEYTQHLIDIAFDKAEYPDEKTRKREVEWNAFRITRFRQTPAHSEFLRQHQQRIAMAAIKSVNVERIIERLRVRRNMTAQEAYSALKDMLQSVRTKEQLQELMMYLPHSQCESADLVLYPIAMLLVHPSEHVRFAAVQLLTRLNSVREGATALKALNPFLSIAFARESDAYKSFRLRK